MGNSTRASSGTITSMVRASIVAMMGCTREAGSTGSRVAMARRQQMMVLVL